MTKKEIKEWLESQQSQALHKCWEDCEKQKRPYLDAYFERSGLRQTTLQIQEHLEQALRLWQEWKQTQETGECLSFPETAYLSLERQLDGFVFKEGAVYEQLLKREISLGYHRLCQGRTRQGEKAEETLPGDPAAAALLAGEKGGCSLCQRRGMRRSPLWIPPS